mmetsp:Transcript_315/g.830  ORF Transcript_315/g.830 Transcript_315/m.830 type:complete len:227 (-) Transcript_315:1361-2041(-)
MFGLCIVTLLGFGSDFFETWLCFLLLSCKVNPLLFALSFSPASFKCNIQPVISCRNAFRCSSASSRKAHRSGLLGLASVFLGRGLFLVDTTILRFDSCFLLCLLRSVSIRSNVVVWFCRVFRGTRLNFFHFSSLQVITPPISESFCLVTVFQHRVITIQLCSPRLFRFVPWNWAKTQALQVFPLHVCVQQHDLLPQTSLRVQRNASAHFLGSAFSFGTAIDDPLSI